MRNEAEMMNWDKQESEMTMLYTRIILLQSKAQLLIIHLAETENIPILHLGRKNITFIGLSHSVGESSPARLKLRGVLCDLIRTQQQFYKKFYRERK
jgi:hypothetical protein